MTCWLPRPHQNTPDVLKECGNKLSRWLDNPGAFPTLNALNTSVRDTRLERRRNFVRVALYLIYRTNLHTNAVIVKRGKEKTWDYPTIGEICAGAKVKPWTAFRCLAMLHNAGFIQNVGRWEGTPGGEVLRTRSTQRIFRDTFFSVIGMAVKLDKEKRARMKEKKYIERNQEKAAAIGLLDGLQDKAYYFAKVIAHLPERLLERIESELQRRRRPA